MARKAADAEAYVCPWWLIHSFDNPLRRLFQRPERILEGLVRPGDACLDVGCGIGYFTIPMARMVGKRGSVTAVDLQPRMLDGVRGRAQKQGLESRIQLVEADGTGLKFGRHFDFILAFWMVHEVPAQENFLRNLSGVLKPGGRLLIVEPKLHVSAGEFAGTLDVARKVGFTPLEHPRVAFSRAQLMTRTNDSVRTPSAAQAGLSLRGIQGAQGENQRL